MVLKIIRILFENLTKNVNFSRTKFSKAYIILFIGLFRFSMKNLQMSKNIEEIKFILKTWQKVTKNFHCIRLRREILL